MTRILSDSEQERLQFLIAEMGLMLDKPSEEWDRASLRDIQDEAYAILGIGPGQR